LSIDSPKDQGKIPAYLKKNGLDVRVLLAGDQGTKGYNFYAASSLFVIDRKGRIAGLPSEWMFKMEEELHRRLPDLLAGKPTPGPLLWSIEKEPKGFSELWREDPEDTVTSLSVAPGTSGRPPEISVLDDSHHWRRYSAQGEFLSNVTLEDDKVWRVLGADLDGDGVNEWIGQKERGFEVMDQNGESYWSYSGFSDSDWLDIGGFPDLDRDGRKEILVRLGDSVTALRNVPTPLWNLDSFTDVQGLIVDPQGGIWVQEGSKVRGIDARGQATGASFAAPGSTVFLGEIDRGMRLFGYRYNSRVDVTHDLDGDGRKDILVVSQEGIRVYSQEGAVLMALQITENQSPPEVALADLDGRKGDEMILYVPQYGLVALGRKGEVEKRARN
jgi:hypothetical protein